MAFPKCRVCGEACRPVKDICPACEAGYDACTADVVAYLRSHGDDTLATQIEDEFHVGAAKKASNT